MPLSHNERIVMGHGSGGRMSHDLIQRIFHSAFDNPILRLGNDAGIFTVSSNTPNTIAISTDSHVVKPLFFPGGDIGRLSICGTVNDISMMGAIPLYLTVGFILEEGLEIITLEKIVASMKTASEEAGIEIIAGDTKVVERGKADGLYINTSGIGVRKKKYQIGGEFAKPGDIILLSGSIGDHGIAVLEGRGELGFSSGIQSDVSPLNHLVSTILETGEKEPGNAIHVLRDPTRGGLATTLNEIARQSHIGIMIDETQIPIHPAVAAACEMLGFDPLYIANEGKLVAFVSRLEADKILDKMRITKYGEDAVIIGEVLETPPKRVMMKTAIGTTRILDMLSGEMLPRIC